MKMKQYYVVLVDTREEKRRNETAFTAAAEDDRQNQSVGFVAGPFGDPDDAREVSKLKQYSRNVFHPYYLAIAEREIDVEVW